MKRRSFIQTAFAAIATAGISKSAAASTPRASVNGIPYPYDVKDMESLKLWISTIDRPVQESNTSTAVPTGQSHRELMERAIFRHDDEKSLSVAKATVFGNVAQEMFSDLVNAPKGTLVWRIRPEEDVYHLAIPADLSRIETRKQAEERYIPPGYPFMQKPYSLEQMKSDVGLWEVDFSADRLIPVDEPLGTWRHFKVYVRYSVVVDGIAINGGLSSRERNRRALALCNGQALTDGGRWDAVVIRNDGVYWPSGHKPNMDYIKEVREASLESILDDLDAKNATVMSWPA